MDIFAQLPPSLWWVRDLFLGLLLGGVAAYFLLRRHRRSSASPSSPSSVCRSEACVRCSAKERTLATARERLDALPQEGLGRLRDALAEGAGKDHPQSLLHLAGLPSRPFWETEDLPPAFRSGVQALEDAWEEICDEMHCFQAEEGGWKSNETSEGHLAWRVLQLLGQGWWREDAAEAFPATMEALAAFGVGLLAGTSGCVLGNVMFSELEAGARIAEHRGPTNARLRCHLALQAPDEASLTVDGEKRRWEEGKCVLFDDYFPHSVAYASESGPARAVLILDLWHPALEPQEIAALQHCFAL